MDKSTPIEYEIKPITKFSLGIKELIQYYELFYFFAWRDIKVKYKQTVLGFLWAIIQPIMLMVVFTVFLSSISQGKTDGLPYPIFVYSGLLFWNIFSSGVNSASNSMITNSGIIKKIYFPRLIIPISSILVVLFDFLMAFLVFFLLLMYYSVQIDFLFFLYLLGALFITILSTFGFGCLLAALSVKYRDFRYVIPFGIQLLLFLSPVIYPVSVIKFPLIENLLVLNPMNGAISLFRSYFSGNFPETSLILSCVASSICIFSFGLYYFRKTEYYFSDLS